MAQYDQKKAPAASTSSKEVDRIAKAALTKMTQRGASVHPEDTRRSNESPKGNPDNQGGK